MHNYMNNNKNSSRWTHVMRLWRDTLCIHILYGLASKHCATDTCVYQCATYVTVMLHLDKAIGENLNLPLEEDKDEEQRGRHLTRSLSWHLLVLFNCRKYLF